MHSWPKNEKRSTEDSVVTRIIAEANIKHDNIILIEHHIGQGRVKVTVIIRLICRNITKQRYQSTGCYISRSCNRHKLSLHQTDYKNMQSQRQHIMHLSTWGSITLIVTF